MIDEKRREVAENLRYLTIGHSIQYKEQFFDELAEVVVGCDEFHDFNAVIDKLADLIDRPTCELKDDCWTFRRSACDDTGDCWTFHCSACGCELDLDREGEPTMWLGGSAMTPRHCPNCGAMVIEEEE